jgi:hypothetical protein
MTNPPELAVGKRQEQQNHDAAWRAMYEGSTQIQLLADYLHPIHGGEGAPCSRCIMGAVNWLKQSPHSAVEKLEELGYTGFKK